MTVDNGAVFYMDPNQGPQFADQANSEIVVAQLTLSGSTTQTMRLNAQGQTQNQYDWSEYNLQFVMSPSRGGAPGGGH